MFKKKHKEPHESQNGMNSSAPSNKAEENGAPKPDNGSTFVENSGNESAENENAQTKINERIAELEGKLAEAEEKNLRLRAEFENYKKRTFRDISEARFNSRFETALPFLSVLDHFRLAVDAAEKKSDFQILHDGMKIILSEFQKALDDIGIEMIDATGKKFDPAIHEAIAKEHSEKVEEGFVISQWRCGYRMGDRLLRPSTVVVSSGPLLHDAESNQTVPSENLATTNSSENHPESEKA